VAPERRLRLFRRLARLATLLALVAVVVGAWVRLTAAGLGCPDWPGCYGHLHPAAATDAQVFVAPIPGHAFDYGKALREMQHRYLATSLGVLILALLAFALWNRREPRQPVLLPAALLLLVCVQGALGRYTVAWLVNPTVVTLHLVGGLATLAVLFWLSLPPRAAALPRAPKLARLAGAALAVLSVQILLGGWTSANYAATACPDLPTCRGSYAAALQFREGFMPWRGVGPDYEGGVLPVEARAAIQVSHRVFATITAFAVLALGAAVWRRGADARARRAAVLAVVALVVQWLIGIHFIWRGFPLALGVAHSLGAALLLLAVLALLRALSVAAPSRSPPTA
jgi:cytochrome c oxidase assembly protein subunit 15